MEKYSLDVISLHPDFKNKVLKKYNVEGVESIGAFGSEPFAIRFRNNTPQKIEVKLSIDGTDIFTGELASTESKGQTWLVNGYGTLELQAYPESNNGGRQFVFTHAENSVALHTHGDISHRGIIAAAVYVEGHVEPISYEYSPLKRSKIGDLYRTKGGGAALYGSKGFDIRSQDIGVFDANIADAGASLDADYTRAESRSILRSQVKEAAVGAGQYVNQKIAYVQGLVKPLFTESIRVRYLWWDHLKEKLTDQAKVCAHPSGFPKDNNHKFINLGNVPMIETPAESVPHPPIFSRI